MLTAEPKSWLSWDFVILNDDEPLVEIDQAWFKEAGTVSINGVECRMYRESMMGDFVLEAAGEPLVRADKPSAFYRAFDVTYDDRVFRLEAESALRRTFVLKEGDAVVGRIYPRSAFTRKATVDLPETLPIVVRVFMLWLVILLWKRAAEASAAGG